MRGSSSLLRAIVVCSLSVVTVWAAPAPADGNASPGAWLGVRLDSGLPGTDGVPVGLVIEDSPAHRAGLRGRDLILAVDGQAVHSPAELIHAIQGLPPGSWVSIAVVRGEEEWDMRLRLAERPEDLGKLRMLHGWIGIEAIDLPPPLREHFGAPIQNGVMVSRIAENSPAEAAGVELGDVVFEVDGRPAASPGQLAALLAGSGVGNTVELRLMRSGLEMVLEPLVEVAPSGPRN